MRGPGPQIWIQELASDGIQFAADRTGLLEPTHSWQTGLIEAPHMMYHSESRTYVLFFSSGTFTEADYKTGYATSKNLLGPYKTGSAPLLETDEPRGIIGPGGQSVVQGAEGHWFLCFHAHNEVGCKGGRRMCVHRLEFSNEGIPRLAGKAHYRRRLRLGAEEDDGIPQEQVQAYQSQHGHSQKPFSAGGSSGQQNAMTAAKKVFNAFKKAM
jgi:beta-xylosidase